MHPAGTVYKAVSINDAADMMVRNHIHRIPVIGEDDTLVGIITRNDILKATLADFRCDLEQARGGSGKADR